MLISSEKNDCAMLKKCWCTYKNELIASEKKFQHLIEKKCLKHIRATMFKNMCFEKILIMYLIDVKNI